MPTEEALDIIKPLYSALLQEEQKHKTAKSGIDAAFSMLINLLEEKGVSYDEFIFSL